MRRREHGPPNGRTTTPGTRASTHAHSNLRRLFSARPTLNTFLPSPHSLLPRFPPHTTEHNHRLGAASIALLDSTLPADGYALPSFVAPRRNTLTYALPLVSHTTLRTLPHSQRALILMARSTVTDLPPRQSPPRTYIPNTAPPAAVAHPRCSIDRLYRAALGGADSSPLLVAAQGASLSSGASSIGALTARATLHMTLAFGHAITLNGPQSTIDASRRRLLLRLRLLRLLVLGRPSHATPTDTSLSIALRIRLPGARPHSSPVTMPCHLRFRTRALRARRPIGTQTAHTTAPAPAPAL
ncbi:hypothetical protein B0H14DRAFT_3755401 [Mycena olivaceomarginata]|nr:hypothetical protein B0H14DRAFT_3755401 [Mycena olivaceomarginata]